MSGPLKNLIVIDLTRAVSGPYCTLTLANLGATIIKIEQPGKGDDTRGLPPFVDGTSSYNAVLNHDKKSIALNLKEEKDRAIFDKLLAKADILVENFRPGVMEKLGYSWETLHSKYPNLIYLAISGYGQKGPISSHACYDLIAQGLSGLMNLTGHSPEHPTKVGTELADIITGIFGALGIGMALYNREKTKKGSLVDIAMLDCMLSLLYSAVDQYSASNVIPECIGNRHASAVPFQTFKTKNRPINIAIANDKLFEKFCTVLNKEEFAKNPEFATIPKRTENREKLCNFIQEVLLTDSAENWVKKCIDAGVPAGRIYNLKETLNFPQLIFRNMVASFKGDYMKQIRFPGNPIKMSCLEDIKEFNPAPKLDENREEILNFINEKRVINE